MSITPTLNARNTVPSSLRKPTQRSRVSPNSYISNSYVGFKKASSLKAAEVTTFVAAQGRFCPMLHEGEDAKLTGSTRSLERRLLALNFGGSRSSSSAA